MKEQLITFDVAKLAKKKGFDWKCYWYCTYKRKIPTSQQSFYPDLGEYKNYNENNKGFYEMFSLPTQSLLQKWLRKVHDNEVFAKSEYKNLKKIGFYYGGNKVQYSTPTFKTYEEALEKGLYQALKLINYGEITEL